MEKIREGQNSPQRAPWKREAPLPSGPMPPKPAAPHKDVFGRRDSLDFDQNAGFHSGPSAKRKGYKLALWSWLAGFIDLLILISLSCVFVVSFSLIVNSPVGEMFRSLQLQQHRLIFFAEVMVIASWLYMVVSRGIMGSSLGEWACDLRLGQPHERLRANYILRVAVRATIVLATGLVVLPLLSLLIGRDLAGSLSGLKLLSLK